MSPAYPKHYTFERQRRLPQFVRAGLLVLVGAVIAALPAVLGEERLSGVGRTAVLVGGLVLAGSGVLALLVIAIAFKRHRPQELHVDEGGLEWRRPGRPKRTVRWDAVASYKTDWGSLVDDDVFFAPEPPALAGRADAGESHISGCLVLGTIGIWLFLVELLVGGGAGSVRFTQTNGRRVIVRGWGSEWDDFVGHVLPDRLPGKRAVVTVAKTGKG